MYYRNRYNLLYPPEFLLSGAIMLIFKSVVMAYTVTDTYQEASKDFKQMEIVV